MPELLLELLSEEIPARMQARAADDLKRLVCDGLGKAGLDYSSAEAFATPRRLALVVDGIPEKQPDVAEERKGPQVSALEKAVEGFLKSVGLDSVDQCEQREIKGRTFYFAVKEKKGRNSAEVLPSLLIQAIMDVVWPKSMRWHNSSFIWVRPLHNILGIFDGKLLENGQGGLALGFGPRSAGFRPLGASIRIDDFGKEELILDFTNKTAGHRFLSPDSFTVKDFADYRQKLNDAHVILEPARRRELIETRAKALAKEAGYELRDDQGLLDEVAGLVEWPVVLVGDIDAEFLDLPDEVLVTAMRHHQKYFSCLDGSGNLAAKFVMVAGTKATDGGKAILAGNERVLKARLADAKFFWNQDRKKKLKDFLPALQDRIFHAKLGSMADKVSRLEKLAGVLAKSIPGCDANAAKRAARLAKADLASEMVGEFPELQGVMGRYYALADGETDEVAAAVRDHYAPAGPNDACPDRPVSVAVALADKIDSLVGFFAIDEKPTGSKDPFALRRAALGVIRLILENKLRLPLLGAFEAAGAKKDSGKDLLAFFADRLKVHLKNKGVRFDLIDAVFALGDDDLVRVLARVEALGRFLATGDGEHLLTAYKRAANILRIEEKKDDKTYSGKVNVKLFDQKEEKDLAKNLDTALPEIAKALKSEDFAAAMTALAGLRRPIDDFFDHVTVNCDDGKLRQNRLKSLALIRDGMNLVADFSRIEGGGH
jgi:glycyl-tRNA synthetase beta chain